MKVEDLGAAYGEGLSWLLELQLLQNPELLNAIVLNIFKLSNRVKNLEFLADQNNKRLLIWLELDWLGKNFHKKNIERSVMEMLVSVIPNFKIRVCYDRVLFDKAVKTVEELKSGKKNPTTTNK
jgi:hypothetical protein